MGEEDQGQMGEREGESQDAWVSGLTDVGLPPWALEKPET